MKKKEELCSFPQQEQSAVVETDIKIVPIAQLQDFDGHPFKVTDNEEMDQLVWSVLTQGLLTPLVVRLSPLVNMRWSPDTGAYTHAKRQGSKRSLP